MKYLSKRLLILGVIAAVVATLLYWTTSRSEVDRRITEYAQQYIPMRVQVIQDFDDVDANEVANIVLNESAQRSKRTAAAYVLTVVASPQFNSESLRVVTILSASDDPLRDDLLASMLNNISLHTELPNHVPCDVLMAVLRDQSLTHARVAALNVIEMQESATCAQRVWDAALHQPLRWKGPMGMGAAQEQRAKSPWRISDPTPPIR